MRPKTAVFILAGDERHQWVNPYLLTNILRMANDPQMAASVEVVMRRPVDVARNYCVAKAKEEHSDYLLMIDNDQYFSGDLLSVVKAMQESNIDIAGIPSGMFSGPADWRAACSQIQPLVYDRTRRFFKCRWIGSGCMIVSARVLAAIPEPLFRMVLSDDGLTLAKGEDQYFCALVREHGFGVWGWHQCLGHLHSVDITSLWVKREQFSRASDPVKVGTLAPQNRSEQWA